MQLPSHKTIAPCHPPDILIRKPPSLEEKDENLVSPVMINLLLFRNDIHSDYMLLHKSMSLEKKVFFSF